MHSTAGINGYFGAEFDRYVWIYHRVEASVSSRWQY